jgi:hypothetical protein
MRAVRAVLVVVGACLVAVGVAEALAHLTVGQLGGLGVWLAGAVVVHDALVAPATAVVSRMIERGGRALSPASRGILRVGLVVGSVLTLVLVPGVVAQGRGTSNPTVLTHDYAVTLGVVWAVVAVVAVVTVASVLVLQRRSDVRGS